MPQSKKTPTAQKSYSVCRVIVIVRLHCADTDPTHTRDTVRSALTSLTLCYGLLAALSQFLGDG
jgi:hypothetical protein